MASIVRGLPYIIWMICYRQMASSGLSRTSWGGGEGREGEGEREGREGGQGRRWGREGGGGEGGAWDVSRRPDHMCVQQRTPQYTHVLRGGVKHPTHLDWRSEAAR